MHIPSSCSVLGYLTGHGKPYIKSAVSFVHSVNGEEGWKSDCVSGPLGAVRWVRFSSHRKAFVAAQTMIAKVTLLGSSACIWAVTKVHGLCVVTQSHSHGGVLGETSVQCLMGSHKGV